MLVLTASSAAARTGPLTGAARLASPPPAACELLHGVAMEVTVELGRTRMSVRELLALCPGDVLELDRAAGSPADLLVNGRLIARGEVVVVDEDFALRVTEIVAQSARELTVLELAVRVVSAWRSSSACSGRSPGSARASSAAATARWCACAAARRSAGARRLAVVEVGSRVLVVGVSDARRPAAHRAGPRRARDRRLRPDRAATGPPRYRPEAAGARRPRRTRPHRVAVAARPLAARPAGPGRRTRPQTAAQPRTPPRSAARCSPPPPGSQASRSAATGGRSYVGTGTRRSTGAPSDRPRPGAAAWRRGCCSPCPSVAAAWRCCRCRRRPPLGARRAAATDGRGRRRSAPSCRPRRAAADRPGSRRPEGPKGRHRRRRRHGELQRLTKKPSTPILTLLGLTLLSLVPAILLTCTSFTKILVVLGLTRNALGLQQIAARTRCSPAWRCS